MSRAQMLRVFVNQRLNAAVEEIFGLFEKTIQGYEEEIDRQRRLLENVLKPEVQINKPAPPQLFVHQEEDPPEQQEWSPSLDPEPRHIKEEQEELWTSHEEEQLQGSEEADIIKFPFTPVPVKSENDEEKPQSSQHNQTQTDQSREAELPGCTSTEQMKTEADGEDCGTSESASNLDPASDVQPANDDQLLSSDCSEIETEGHISLSGAERLLNAIVGDNSEVEDLSDGDADDPGVEQLSDEDYIPPDAPESGQQSGDDSDSEPRLRPHASKHAQRSRGRVRKRQRGKSVDADGEPGASGHGERDDSHRVRSRGPVRKRQRGKSVDEPGPSKDGRGERWKSGAFTPDLVQLEAEDEKLHEREDWQPLDYVEQCIDTELMKLIADCKNVMSLGNSGSSLNTCDADVEHAQEENAHLSRHGKKHQVTPVPHVSVRTTSAAHLPEMVNLKNAMRCREKGCSGKSRVRCVACNVFLCLQTERNCFAAFHTGQ
ncbi:uncharacterized protein [Centroberyx affinis]|uniref:uncharacterized protein isoform X1 n=1 Tax=Centroberyx affinis TaxID=166261 RepID=UPI003A5C6F10